MLTQSAKRDPYEYPSEPKPEMPESAFTPQRHIICDVCKTLFFQHLTSRILLTSKILLVKTSWILKMFCWEINYSVSITLGKIYALPLNNRPSIEEVWKIPEALAQGCVVSILYQSAKYWRLLSSPKKVWGERSQDVNLPLLVRLV